MAIITLLTDFGTQDEYVGVLKGVILGIHPQVTLVDVSHHIPPQNITAAGHALQSAYGFFPEGTVHLAIVDPGVGSTRSILVARFDGYLFMAPDNGLLPLVWEDRAPDLIVRVDNNALFRQPVSRTFHGRDIFAPVAAHLSKRCDPAKGFDLTDVGRPMNLEQVHRLEIEGATQTPSGMLVGEVVSVDRFGNLITNIKVAQVEQMAGKNQRRGIVIDIGGCRIEGLTKTYGVGMDQKPLALIGSRNCIEIAVNGGNAARILGVGHGTKVSVS